MALLSLIVNHCFLFNQSAFLSQSVVFTSRLSLCVHTYLSNHELFVPKQQTAHLTVFCFCIMAGVFGDYSQLFRLFHASVIKRFVRRENPERELQLKKKKFSDTSGEEDSMFVAETASLLESVSGIKQRRHRSVQDVIS